MSKLLNFITDNSAAIKEDLISLVKAESPTHRKEYVDFCGNEIRKVFHKLLGNDNWNCTVHKRDQRGDHLLFEEKKASGPRVLFLSHFDTVWDIGAIPIREEGEKIYGPGIFDMKAGLLSSIWAIHALQKTNKTLPISPVFLFTSDEEFGSTTSRELIEATAGTCEAALIFEPPIAKSMALKTERKGVGKYKIKVKGKKAHAGNDHEKGCSAIKELAQQILKLESFTNYEKGTTVNVGLIKGGSNINVIPSYAEAYVDFRVKTSKEGERMVSLIEELEPVDKSIELLVEGNFNRPPLIRNNKNKALYELAVHAGEKLNIHIKQGKAGGGSDGNFTSSIGVPTLDGLGIPGGGPHALSEHIDFSEFPIKCTLVAQLCLEIAAAVKDIKKIS